MGLFNWKRKESETVEQEMQDGGGVDAQPINRERFIMEERVESQQLPIYAVFARLQEDWETKGYVDGKAFPETVYKEQRKSVIVNTLLLHIREVMTSYEDKITELDTCIKQASKNGFVQALERYEHYKSRLNRHYEMLQTMEADIIDKGQRISAILLSYDMGFARGIAAVGDEKVNNIMGA